MVEVKNLYKSFGDLQVLKDINYTFKEGLTTVIIGASGSGKSTLLRCLNELETPQSGSIEFEGVNINDITHSQLMSKVGMLILRFLFDHFFCHVKCV